MRRTTLLCLLALLYGAAAWAAAIPGEGAAEAPLAATVSRSTIAVGETTVVTLSGGQFQRADRGTEFPAGFLKLRRLDTARWEITGLKPCDCVAVFGDGKATVRVRITVVKE